MTSNLRERRRQMLRDEILEAARAMLAEKGYATMSMDDLAARVGVSKPTLYSHFANKDELIVEAATSLLEQFIEVIDQGRAGRTPLQHLTFLLHTLIQMQIESGAFTVQISMPEVFHLLCGHPVAFTYMQQIDQVVVTLVQEACNLGEIDPQLDAATVVRAFHALAKAPYAAIASTSGLPNIDRVADMVTTIFRRGVGACGVIQESGVRIQESE